jgi:hypothetical protein
MSTEKDEPDHRPLREIQGTDGLSSSRAGRDGRIEAHRLRVLIRAAHRDALELDAGLDEQTLGRLDAKRDKHGRPV